MTVVRPTFALRFDSAHGVRLGARERQEDALICDFPAGSNMGFAVLADGMGGHSAGDIASKIVVTEVFSELKMRSGTASRLETGLRKALEGAAQAANACLNQFVAQRPAARGMGATLLAPVLVEDRLHWISIGDSPLYLFRDGALRRLNELHTMAARRERAANAGRSPNQDRAVGLPDQDGLTSALVGGRIAEIDCPHDPLRLRCGDILMAASDGVNSIDDAHLQSLLQQSQAGSARDICDYLLRAIDDLADPAQDNVSFCLIKVISDARPAEAEWPTGQTATRDRSDKAVTIVASISRPAGWHQ